VFAGVVEGTERISRFSFIGLDYLDSQAVDRDPAMLERIRTIVGKYRLDRSDLPFPGGAVCTFTYDAARALEPVLHRAQAEAAGRRAVRDALIVVPGTWMCSITSPIG